MHPHPSAPNLAVLGVGYMGGSLALAARQAGLVGRVTGYDPDPAAGLLAKARGIVDEVTETPVAAVRGAGIVVLAGPVRSLGDTAQAIAGAVGSGALVIDIGSVKAPVVARIEATALAGRFVGCHPLAGTERTGTAAADAGLYAGNTCLICPGPRAADASIAAALGFWSGLGAQVLRMDPEQHDVFMAAASHLPHVAAFSLAASLIDVADMVEARTPPASPPTSLRSTTRVAASSPVVWRDIFLANRVHLLPLMRTLEAKVGELRAALEADDGAATERFLAAARDCRNQVVKG